MAIKDSKYGYRTSFDGDTKEMICDGIDDENRDIVNNVCICHTYGCIQCSYEYLDGIIYREEASFKYKGELYCSECLADILGVNIKEVTYQEYTDSHGYYLGNSIDTSLENILLDCSFVESLGD